MSNAAHIANMTHHWRGGDKTYLRCTCGSLGTLQPQAQLLSAWIGRSNVDDLSHNVVKSSSVPCVKPAAA
jgi:hypothetical protein